MNHGNGNGYVHLVTPNKPIPEESKPHAHNQSDMFRRKWEETSRDGRISYFSVGFP